MKDSALNRYVIQRARIRSIATKMSLVDVSFINRDKPHAIGFIAIDSATGKRCQIREPFVVAELEPMTDALIEDRIRSAMWPK